MKALLVNPSTKNMIRTHVPQYVEKESGITPPLNLLYLATYANVHTNHKVEVLDNALLKLDSNGLEAEIARRGPDIVGVTVTTFTLIDALEVARAAKRAFADVRVVFGGAHTMVYPEVTAALKEVDYCVIGEGEETFAQLMSCLENDGDLSRIKGLVYEKGGKIVNTGMKPFNNQLDSLPFPDRNLLPKEKYYSLLSKNFPITTLITSRGCPFNCLYCDRRNNGRKFRARSSENIVQEMELIKQMNIQEVFFLDDTFTVDRRRVKDFAARVIERKLEMEWDIRSRIDGVDLELIRLLKKAGCNRIHFGIEAGTPRIQKVLRKNVDLEKAVEIIRICRGEGIETLAYFMLGSPTETREEIEETINYSLKLNSDYAQFAITTPFPGTDLYQQGLDLKLYSNDYWAEFAQSPCPGFVPRYWTEILSEKKLLDLLTLAHKRFYSRPGYLWKSLLEVGSFKDFLKKFSAGMKILFH